jgi:hypothetical protein
LNIIDALRSRTVFAPLFKDPRTWRAWEVYLRGLFGLEMEDPKDKRTFKDWTPYLSPSERGWIFIIANDKQQAGIIKAYVSGIFHRVACLKSLIEKETVETLELRNGVNIAVKTASFRSLRGYTILCAILEEIAFWRSEESANPGKEILSAVRPALATVPDSLLLGISTPYSRAGVLFDMFKAYDGQPGGPLIWKAPRRPDGRLSMKAWAYCAGLWGMPWQH